MQIKAEQNKPSLNFNFGMKAFEAIMQSNFLSIQDTLILQQKQINRINSLVQTFLNKQGTLDKMPNKSKSEEPVKQAKTDNLSSIVLNMMSKDLTKQGIKSQDGNTKEQQKKQPLKQETVSQEKVLKDKNEVGALTTQKHKNELQLSSVGIKLQNNDLLEEKIFELFERVRQLQQKQSNSERFNLKKFREFEFQIQQSILLAQKSIKSQSEFDQTIDKIRNELTEYKLKKQSKILKALNSTSLSQTSTSDNYDYIAQKIQYVLKHMNELTPKKIFQEERELLHQSIENLRRKINQTVNQTYLQETLKVLESRIYQSVSKYIKALQFQPNSEKGISDKTNELQSIIDEGNRQLTKKISEHQRKIQQLKEDVVNFRNQFQLHKKQKIQFQDSSFDLIRQQQQKNELLSIQNQQIKKFIQNLKQGFESKQIQNQNQIIQLQESVEKLNSTLKTYTTSLKDTFMRSSNSLINQNIESQISQDKGSNLQIENELKSQQKKFNKLQGKVQSLKEDILNYRNDLMRQIDGLKANLQKKADWESLKKGLSFVQQKIKETKAITQAIYESNGKEEGDSLAVKKGWTCLVCDKDIKSYQGKLGELKFTSMFPIRQSPRIGGYYKQQQASQEYRQVFLTNSNNNLNRSKRIGSLKSNQSSKEELQLQK